MSQEGVTIRPRWAMLAAIAATFLAYLPVLLIYLPQLWARQYYRFFPFAFAATVGLAVARADMWSGMTASRLRWTVRGLAFVLAESMVALGLWSQSPWPCFVAFVITIGIILDFWNEAGGVRSLVYLILPMLLVVRPPLHLDESIVQWLQTITSRASSTFLTGLGIDHLLSGNVIEPFMGAPLLVEEACSGVQSLFTLMFVAAFLSVYRRYTLTRSILLTATAVMWALMMNIFRVIAIVVAQTQFQVDLTTGWQHELVGYTGMLLAITMLLSSDRLLLFAIGGIPDLPLSFPRINVFITAWNWLMVAPEVQESGTARADRTSRTADDAAIAADGSRKGSRAAVFTLAGVLAFALVVATPAWGLPGLTSTGTSDQLITELDSVDASWLTEARFPDCRVLSFETRQRSAESQFGQRSEEWMLSAPFGNVLNSMDHVFDSWHDLTVCYRSIGWQRVTFREVSDPSLGDTAAEWPAVYAEFVKPTGERAHLCFSLFTIDGTPVLSEGHTSGLSGISRRIRQSRLDGQQVIQVQTLNESIVELTPEAIQELIRIHGQAREELRSRVVTTLNAESDHGSQATTSGGAE